MKKITFTIALITLAAMAAFAAGTSEENTMPWSGVRGQYQTDAVISEKATTITGTINLVEDGHVELLTDSGTYELVYPYRLSYAADIQNGMEITVEGFEAEGLRMDNDTATKNLVLKSATINGEIYNLADVSNNFGRNGQRGNMSAGNRFDDNSALAGNGARGNVKGNRQGGFSQNNSMGRVRR